MDYTKDAINQFTYDYEMRKFSGNFKFNVGKSKLIKIDHEMLIMRF